ncbi:MAG: LamG-like jellyroll fold domain-containing protein, partial [Candidatus Falkowbacteria bacterium]
QIFSRILEGWKFNHNLTSAGSCVDQPIYNSDCAGTIGCWLLNGNTTDGSANKLDTRTVGTVTFPNSQAARFTGDPVNPTNYIEVEDDKLKVTTGLTMVADIYPEGPGGDDTLGGAVVGKEGEYMLFRNANGTIAFAFADGNGWFNGGRINTSFVAPFRQWTHLIFTLDAPSKSVEVFANGISIYDNTFPAFSGTIGDAVSTMNGFCIGRRQSITGTNIKHAFQGQIAGVKVYNRALTATEIQAQYQGTCSINPNCSVGNHCTADKGKLSRDFIRQADLYEMNMLLDNYKAGHGGKCPILAAGTYMANYSISTWPSWQETLGSALGTQLPVDPINELTQCKSTYADDIKYNLQTCWNESEKKFADPLPNNNQLDMPTNSLAYLYWSSKDGKTCGFYIPSETGLMCNPMVLNKNGNQFSTTNSALACRGAAPATGDCNAAYWTYDYNITEEGQYYVSLETSNSGNSPYGPLNLLKLGSPPSAGLPAFSQDPPCDYKTGVQHNVKVLLDGAYISDVCADAVPLPGKVVNSVALGQLSAGLHKITIDWTNDWTYDPDNPGNWGNGNDADSNIQIHSVKLNKTVNACGVKDSGLRPSSSSPNIVCGAMQGVAGQKFEGYFSVSGAYLPLTVSVQTGAAIDWTSKSWSAAPVKGNTAVTNNYKLTANKTGAVGGYSVTINVTDKQGTTAQKVCAIGVHNRPPILNCSVCVDRDGDGYGALGSTGCPKVGVDCDDTPGVHKVVGLNGTVLIDGNKINPGQPDDCSQVDGIDNDCDGDVDNHADLSHLMGTVQTMENGALGAMPAGWSYYQHLNNPLFSNASVSSAENHTSGGNKSLLIKQKENITMYYTCSAAACNDPNFYTNNNQCFWDAANSICYLQKADNCNQAIDKFPTGPNPPYFSKYANGVNFCWASNNPAAGLSTKFDLSATAFQLNEKYLLDFYYKGESSVDSWTDFLLTYSPSWSGQCWNQSVILTPCDDYQVGKSGYSASSSPLCADYKTIYDSLPAGSKEQAPGLFNADPVHVAAGVRVDNNCLCLNLKKTLANQTGCYPAISGRVINGGSYPDWVYFSTMFDYNSDLDQLKNETGARQILFALNSYSKKTGPAGTNLYVDDLRLRRCVNK